MAHTKMLDAYPKGLGDIDRDKLAGTAPGLVDMRGVGRSGR